VIDNRVFKIYPDTRYWLMDTGYKSPVTFVKSINEKIILPVKPKVD
jgi:hypothetical protein